MPPARALLALTLALPPALPAADNAFAIDARAPVPAPVSGYLEMGRPGAGTSPTGAAVGITSRYLTRDGRPWFPVMGELHFTRVPAADWEEELLKMKAGGVDIVATYVFWIHHEELEGQFDWSGPRDLRRFVGLCGRHGLKVWLRIGPWDHGEVRNGGFPDWLPKRGPVRVNDPGYLGYAARWYDQIGRQVGGLLWKQGGPVIGVQLENEYSDRSPQGGAAHISRLKELAVAAGLDVPLYSVTGWDNAAFPPRTVVPVFGGYPDAPWAGTLAELPPDSSGVYQFVATDADAGIRQGGSAAPPAAGASPYPRLTAELGAGLEPTYHRRVLVEPEAIAPLALSALGSGVTLLGYYMFHGGTNPDGRLSTLQESQATGYPNDVPVKSYDFQAPLGEFGQERASYGQLKVIHQFLRDFGPALATTARWLPDRRPAPRGDDRILRVAARTDGDRGFLIVNNYVRRHPLPAQPGFQVTVQLPGGTVRLPADPVTVPAQASFLWPINLPLGGAVLRYATAQPFLHLTAAGAETFAFAAVAGIEPEFCFAAPTLGAIEAPGARIERAAGLVRVRGLAPSRAAALTLRDRQGARARVLLLSPADAAAAWKVEAGAQETILLSRAEVFGDGGTLHLRARAPADLAYGVFPDRAPPADGLFSWHVPPVAAAALGLGIEPLRPAGTVPAAKLGPPVAWRGGAAVALAPDDGAFALAAAWQLTPPAALPPGVDDAFLEIRYAGDVARLSEAGHLRDDDFYLGRPWEVGLKRFYRGGGGPPLTLEVLPLRADAPLYLPADQRPDFHGQAQVAELLSARLVPEYEVILGPDLRPRP